jgi:beta-lactamase class D
MKLLFLSLLLLVTACTHRRDLFFQKDVCFLLFDLKANRFTEIYNERRCDDRYAPVSLFEIPLAVIAFDAGVVKREDDVVYKWNGVPHPWKPKNRDYTVELWMRDNAGWLTQDLAEKIGVQKIQEYLAKFEYGNQDMTGGVRFAWFTPNPYIKDVYKNSLRLTAFEKLRFMKNLWRNELPVTQVAQEKARNLMRVETLASGDVLTYKYAQGFTDTGFDQRLGWFVGHLVHKGSPYLVVLNFHDRTHAKGRKHAGEEATELALKYLREKHFGERR